MDGVVGQGTLLAGRYRLLRPIPSDLTGAAAWDANDQILDRAVRVALLTEGRVPQAVDAARRAALVADPRLVRVLDVGDHEGIAYMITEPVTGSSLAQLVSRGPLPADQARAIVGEAAAALEAARRRGVHHLTLRPAVLHLAADDRVLITGLAVDGALLGQGIGDARSTTRADTVGLVALLYAALTGRWPGAAFGSGDPASPTAQLPAAPLVSGRPVAPSELVAGIPNDLDTLCAVTLGPNDDGPHSPAELVLELEPWGSIRASDLLAAAKEPQWDPTTTSAASARKTAVGTKAAAVEPAPVSAPPTVQRQSVRSAFAAQPPGTAARPATPPAAAPARSSEFGAVSGVGAGAATAAGVAAASAAAAAAARDASARTAADAATQAAAVEAARASAQSSTAAPTAVFASTPPPAFPPAEPTTSRALPTPPAGQSRPTTPPADDLRPGSALPRSTGSTAAGPSATAAPVALPAAGGQGTAPRAFDEVVSVREAPATKRFDPTRLVLAVVVVAVILGLYLAVQALTAPIKAAQPRSDPLPTVSAPAEEVPEAEAEATPAPVVDPGAAPAIVSGQSLDPPPGGDDNEHPEAAPLAIDGDPGTFWFTRTFNSPAFSGLKAGVGYAVSLQAPANVSTVTLQVNGTGGQVEVRSTAPSTPTEGPVLASGTLGGTTVLTLSAPTETQSIVLWFTSLPQTADGKNRLELAEVSVS